MLTKRRVVACKVETLTGTAETLSAADCFYAADVTINDTTEVIMREDDGSQSKRTGIVSCSKGEASLKIQVKGSGTAGTSPLWALRLLPACAMAETAGVWKFTSAAANFKTVTFAVYEDGIKKQIHGAMASFSLEGEAGKPWYLTIKLTGIWDAPVDAAMLTPEADTVKPPPFLGSTFTFGASALAPTAKFSLESGSEVTLREDATNAGGYISAFIGKRDVKGKLDPEATLVATRDYFGDFKSGVEQAISVSIGAIAGNIITIAAPKAQAVQVTEGDRNGIVTHEHEFSCNKSTAAGDDELSITFG